MPKQEVKKSGYQTKLLCKLTFAPEARTGGEPPEISGRIRYFFTLFRSKSGAFLLCNILFLVTCLPLLALLILSSDSVYGMEKISYLLQGIKQQPYYMLNSGIGLSDGNSINVGYEWILSAYQYLFLAIGGSIFFTGFGLAGLFKVAIKLVWKDEFVSKKDSYGNKVPRLVYEFFAGIKKHWVEMTIVSVFTGLMVAALGNAFAYFAATLNMGTAGGGEWVLVIVASLVSLVYLCFLMQLLPMIVMYKLPFLDKVKNAAILTITMPLQNLLLAVISILPFLLIALLSGFISIIIVAVVLVFGGVWYSLMWCTYTQMYAERIITPLFEETKKDAYRKKGKKGKK